MSDADTAWWAWFWGQVENWAFLGVVVALAIEFAALKLGAPYKAKIEAAKDLKIAELNNETARLRKQVGPRQIDLETFLKALEGRPTSPAEIMFPKENGEAFLLAIQFRDLLRLAKWQVAEPVPVPPSDIPRLANQPSHMAAGGQPMGVTVAVRADTQDDFQRLEDRDAPTAVNALSQAIQSTLGGVSGYAAGPDVYDPPPAGTIRIIVGPKP